MNILHIDSCVLGDQSRSRLHTAAIVADLATACPNARVVQRDLAATPLSHVSGPLLQAMSRQWNAAIPMHPALRAEILLSAALLQEFIEADVVVVGAPMDNYFAPSALKVWLDRLLHGRDARENDCMAQIRLVLVTSGGEPRDKAGCHAGVEVRSEGGVKGGMSGARKATMKAAMNAAMTVANKAATEAPTKAAMTAGQDADKATSTDASIPAQARLALRYEEQLQAAFASLGVRQLRIARSGDFAAPGTT